MLRRTLDEWDMARDANEALHKRIATLEEEILAAHEPAKRPIGPLPPDHEMRPRIGALAQASPSLLADVEATLTACHPDDWPEFLTAFRNADLQASHHEAVMHAWAAMSGTRFDLAVCPDKRPLFEALEYLQKAWTISDVGSSLRENWLVHAQSVEHMHTNGAVLTESVYKSIIMGEAGKWLNGDPSKITDMVFDPLLAGFSWTAPAGLDATDRPAPSPAWSLAGAFELRRAVLTRALEADDAPEQSEIVTMADNALTMCVALQSRMTSLDACLRQLEDPARVRQLNLTPEEVDTLSDIGEAESGQLRVALEGVLEDSAQLLIRLNGLEAVAGGMGEDVVKAYLRDICYRVLEEPTPPAGEANTTPWRKKMLRGRG